MTGMFIKTTGRLLTRKECKDLRTLTKCKILSGMFRLSARVCCRVCQDNATSMGL